jgi:tetratricopeptide (TPR) repeat protein
MASNLPIVRQVAWLSIVPQLGMLALLMSGAYVAGFKAFVVVGAAVYLVISFGLRRFIARDHRLGVALFRRGRFADALEHFQRSYEFFARRRWLDDWRFVTLFSSSRISYREMPLLNVAYCYGQIGDGARSKEYYERVTHEFPGSRIAEAALRMFEAAKTIAEPGTAPNGGLAAPLGNSGAVKEPPPTI